MPSSRTRSRRRCGQPVPLSTGVVHEGFSTVVDCRERRPRRPAADRRRSTPPFSSVLPGSVLTGTAELTAPVTNSRVIDQLTLPADPSQTASQQEAGQAVQKRPGHRRRSTRIHGELHGPSTVLCSRLSTSARARGTRWEGVCAAPVFVLAAPAGPVGQREPSSSATDDRLQRRICALHTAKPTVARGGRIRSEISTAGEEGSTGEPQTTGRGIESCRCATRS